MTTETTTLLRNALAARQDRFDVRHEAALRLFNGFYEGDPDLAIDLYGRSVVIHDYAEGGDQTTVQTDEVVATLLALIPWLNVIVLKQRKAEDPQARQGRVIHGSVDLLARKVREHGVWYAIDLLLNRDASFYLDTRLLRDWIKRHAAGQSVLNTFAYTGSLGVAALAGGATRVVQLDLNRAFLNIAKTSYTLNGLPINKRDFITGDFWTAINQLKRQDERFDWVLVDPPFFSTTTKGKVDLENHSARVINKVRPLINDGGRLVVINNALFTPGAVFHHTLEQLGADGYLSIEELIPVPPDCTGYPTTVVSRPPVDPAPFNHATKIAVLKVRRKGPPGQTLR